MSVVDQWWQCQNHHGPTKIPRPIPIAIMISLRISGGVLIIHGRATEVSRFLPCLSFPGVSGDRLRGVLTFGERNRRIRRDGPVGFPIRWSARSGRRMSIARRSRFAGHHMRGIPRTALVENMIRWAIAWQARVTDVPCGRLDVSSGWARRVFGTNVRTDSDPNGAVLRSVTPIERSFAVVGLDRSLHRFGLPSRPTQARLVRA